MFRIFKSNRKFKLCITAKRQNLSHVQWVAKYFEFLIGSWQQKVLCIFCKILYLLPFLEIQERNICSNLKFRTKGSRLKWQRITCHKDAKMCRNIIFHNDYDCICKIAMVRIWLAFTKSGCCCMNNKRLKNISI